MRNRLYELFKNCNNEEEVKYAFCKYFKYNVDTREKIDLYSPEILFEFKYNINMSNVIARSKAIAQSLYYIKRLKYGNDVRIPSQRICVLDKNEAMIIETEKLKDFYYLSKAPKYDWDLAPSNPCKRLVHDLAASDIIKNIYVYQLQNIEAEKEFIETINVIRNGKQITLFNNKKEINENNFFEIFKYWKLLFGEYVENGRKSSEYFVTDIEFGRTSVIDNSQVLFRMNSGENVTKYLPISKYNHFWETYEKIIDTSRVSAIRQKMDRMTEVSLRRFTGEFFTSLLFAEKGLDYLGRVIGTGWWTTGKYRIWDMAAGTGNLEYLLPADAYKYCYISTLLDDDAEYCKKIFPEATVFQYDYLNDDVNILFHNELLKMGVKYKLPDKLVQDLNDSSIKWILLFNPPYVTSNNNERKKGTINKEFVSMTDIQKEMTKEDLGEVSRELFSQFLYRISIEFKDKSAYIAMFSKIKYINSNNDQKLRDSFFRYKFERGFIFSSKNFDSCKAEFPIGFMIWNMSVIKDLSQQSISVDVYNNNAEKIGIKHLKVESRSTFLSKWIRREKNVNTMPPLSSAITIAYNNRDKRDSVAENFLASFMCKGNDFANQNYTALLSSPYVSAGALSITKENFEKALIVYTVRRLPQATWINDRDQFMQPIDAALQDSEFIVDCVLWALFSSANNTASLDNVYYEGIKYRIKNELFPFLKQELKNWVVSNANMRVEIYANENERYAAKWIATHTLSAEAQNLLESAKILYQYFYQHINEVAWPKFKITNWDVGWWQVHMSLKDSGLGSEELDNVKKFHKKLGEKILPKIYMYHFLEYDYKNVEQQYN